MKRTENQRLQLLALLRAGGVSRACSVRTDAMAMANVMVLGRLRDLGLADSRSMRRLGRSWTEYWLTPAGVDEARALALIEVAGAAGTRG